EEIGLHGISPETGPLLQRLSALQPSLYSSAQVCGAKTPWGTPRIIGSHLGRSRPSLRMRNGGPSPTSCTCYRRTLARRSYLYSERSRVGPRPCGSLRARLRVRETRRTGWGQTHVSHETPRVHHAARRRGRMAARGARAATRASEAHRDTCAIHRR